MFSTIKENILNKLEKTYKESGEAAFKSQFSSFVKILKENKDLKEFYEIYDLFSNVNFEDDATAREFVEEGINRLKQLDKSQIEKLKEITEGTLMEEKRSMGYRLDQLIFNENINLKDKTLNKMSLIKHLTTNTPKTTRSDYKEVLSNLDKRINDKVTKLTNEQTEILDMFIENDSERINTYYTTLINETEQLVENKILIAENGDVVKRLVEVKRKLKSLKDGKPEILDIEDIIELKESFNENP